MKRNFFLLFVVTSFMGILANAIRAGSPASQKSELAKRVQKAQTQTLDSPATGTAAFNHIGFLPGDNSSQVRASNADGTVAIGTSGLTSSNPNTSGRLGVKWTSSGGLVALPGLPSDGTSQPNAPFITASDVTATGSWIAYRARPGGNGRREAVICTGDLSQVIPLGRLLANRGTAANQISDDGSIVFGFGEDADFFLHAFRWTQAGGIVQLSEPAGYNYSTPTGRGVTPDGAVSVGELDNYDLDTGNELDKQAYRWTSATSFQEIGYLPGGTRSSATAVSPDGSKIFGVSNSTNVPGTFNPNTGNSWNYDGELFWWTSTGGMTLFGNPPGYDTFDLLAGMSSDAALVVFPASSSTAQGPPGTYIAQTGSHQFFFLSDLLVTAGAGPAISGWSSLGALGISDDGNTVFGQGTDPIGNSEGWLAQFPPDYLRNIQTFNATSSSTPITINSGDFIGRSGNYSASSIQISNGTTPAALTLSGNSNCTVGSAITVVSTGTLNLLDTAIVHANSLTENSGGKLRIDGSLSVQTSASINGSLQGIGAITGSVSLGSTGQLSPGDSPGTFTINGGLTAASGSLFNFEINGTVAGSFDQLVSSGPINLSAGPTLNIAFGYTPSPGDQFALISSGQPIQGTFAGIPEQGFFSVGNMRLRATYSGGAGNDFVVTVASPVNLTSVTSRQLHGAQSFDVTLYPPESASTECRNGNGSYTVVFTFADPLMHVAGASASGGALVAGSAINNSDTHQYIVNLSGVQNAQRTTVSLSNVDDSTGKSSVLVTATLPVLVGDTNGDGTVNSGDVGQTKAASGSAVGATNFREDVNIDGVLNSGDVGFVKSHSGTALP